VSDSYTMRVAEAVETLRADNARLIAEVADLRHDLERSMSTGGSENELQFGTELLGAVGWIGSDRSAPRAAPHRMRVLQMTRGTRVRLIGKKRTAYVRSARRTPAGLEIQLTKPLGGYVWHMASELEVI
jgi:hypothetical protein